MKKLKVILVSAMILTLGSCGSSITGDAEKVAELQCEAQKLTQKALSGDAAGMQESKELLQKAQQLSQEFQNKYTTPEEKQEFQRALVQASKKCN